MQIMDDEKYRYIEQYNASLSGLLLAHMCLCGVSVQQLADQRQQMQGYWTDAEDEGMSLASTDLHTLGKPAHCSSQLAWQQQQSRSERQPDW